MFEAVISFAVLLFAIAYLLIDRAQQDRIISAQSEIIEMHARTITTLKAAHRDQEEALRIVFGIDAPTLAWMEEETGERLH